MAFDNIRVYELAKELNISTKDLMDKIKSLNLNVASHSSALTLSQIQKIKENINQTSNEIRKPKAFIIKKSKAVEEVDIKKENIENDSVDEEDKKFTKILPPQRPKVDIKSIIEARQQPYKKEKRESLPPKKIGTTILPPRSSEFKKDYKKDFNRPPRDPNSKPQDKKEFNKKP